MRRSRRVIPPALVVHEYVLVMVRKAIPYLSGSARAKPGIHTAP